MAINLTNFEKEVDDRIVKRGKEYWRDGLVQDLEEIDTGEWSALVEGSEVYEVKIKVDQNKIEEYSCSCPYDLGPVRKHVVAVLYALSNQPSNFSYQNTSSDKRQKKIKRKPTVAERIDHVLGSMSADDLIDFIRDQVMVDRRLRVKLFAHAATPNSIEGRHAYRQMIKESLRAGMGPDGFIDYYGAGRAMRGVDELLQQADKILEEDNPSSAIPLYQVVMEELLGAVQGADDSNGEIGGGIDYAIEQLGKCATLFKDTDGRRKLFRYLLGETREERHSGWEWKWDLLNIAAGLISGVSDKQALFRTLDELGHKDSGETNYSDHYDMERMLEIKLLVLEREGDGDEVQEFMRQHATYPSMRKRLLESAFAKKDYQQVKLLAEQGIKQDAEYLGLVINWQQWLYKVAQAEQDVKSMRYYLRELFLHSGEWKYMNDLKKTFTSLEWAKERTKLISDIRQGQHYRVELAELYVREQLWDELLAFAKHHVSQQVLDMYYRYLFHLFPTEYLALYQKVLQQKIEEIPRRSGGYEDIRDLLKTVKKLGAKEQADKIVIELLEKFKNRPALRRVLLQV